MGFAYPSRGNCLVRYVNSYSNSYKQPAITHVGWLGLRDVHEFQVGNLIDYSTLAIANLDERSSSENHRSPAAPGPRLRIGWRAALCRRTRGERVLRGAQWLAQ